MWQPKPWLLSLALLGAILFVGGLIWLSFSGEKKQAVGIELIKSGETEAEVYVDVAGAVQNPGMFKLSNGSRVNDALTAAGGLSEEADRDWVETTLNLAAKVSDGDKLYIPTIGQAEVKSAASDKININTASLSQLDILYGVGPATAQKIIDGRPYSKIEDLVAKKAVSQTVFDRIKDEISLY